MKYAVEPGLYAVGNPGSASEVLLSANYKLSFDLLRRELGGMDLWVIVLDTKGINVWCAAGKGTFGTRELIERIIKVRLDKIVSHRRIIAPQLGAPGIHAHIVEKSTGFKVLFGPVYASDLKAYIDAGYKAASQMRAVRFGFRDRLVLTPMEIVPALKKEWPWLVAAFAYAGLNQEGVYFKQALVSGTPLVAAILVSFICGSFFVPVLLPFIPFRAFALKGWLFCAAVLGALFPLVKGFAGNDIFLLAAVYISLPLLSSYIAFNFTGATPFTNISGVKKELKVALPVYISGIVLTILLLAGSRLHQWGIV
jgi:hypothetical protein